LLDFFAFVAGLVHGNQRFKHVENSFKKEGLGQR
jgi:hypothetical protein